MKKTKLLFFITILTFVAIILFLSAIYPESQDEIRFSHDTFAAVFSQIKLTFTTDAPRFTVLLNVFLLRFPIAWKIIFTILNPLVQLFIILSLFFIITGKKVNLENKQNFYLFLLLILMYLYLIPCPSNTIFWLSGTLAYSWGFVPPLILLCLFRKTIDGKELKTSSLNNFLITLCGFAAGMSNENTGPMMLGLTVLFFIYCKYKKIKIPSLYYFALAGIILGLTAMFGSGAGTARLNASITNRAWQNLPITSKLFLFIWHFNRFLAATFWLPIINLLGLLLILYDKKKLALKDKDFILSSLFCICGFALSLVLFAAPYIDLRAHYSSAIFFFISFTIMLLLLWKFYNINFIKYLALILLIM